MFLSKSLLLSTTLLALSLLPHTLTQRWLSDVFSELAVTRRTWRTAVLFLSSLTWTWTQISRWPSTASGVHLTTSTKSSRVPLTTLSLIRNPLDQDSKPLRNVSQVSISARFSDWSWSICMRIRRFTSSLDRISNTFVRRTPLTRHSSRLSKSKLSNG